jgi:hypothetical protein
MTVGKAKEPLGRGKRSDKGDIVSERWTAPFRVCRSYEFQRMDLHTMRPAIESQERKYVVPITRVAGLPRVPHTRRKANTVGRNETMRTIVSDF